MTRDNGEAAIALLNWFQSQDLTVNDALTIMAILSRWIVAHNSTNCKSDIALIACDILEAPNNSMEGQLDETH